MTATAVDERSLLPGPTWPPCAPPTSFPLADRRPVVLADDPCQAGSSGAGPEYVGIYLHARYFDPQLGTFLSPDPIGVRGGLNLYGYGFGNPIGFADRTGLLADANGCDGGSGVPYYVDGILQFPTNVHCPGGGGGGGGAWDSVPGHAPSTGPVVGSPGSTYPPDDGYGGHGTPVCKPGDPNCAKTECKPGDPNCDKTACKPGDPGCEEQPPACQAGDPACTAGPEPERPKNAHAAEQPFQFRDPCSTGFGGRLWDSVDYQWKTTWGEIGHAAEMVEMAVPAVVTTTIAAYAEAARRHGGSLLPMGSGGFLGAPWLGSGGTLARAAKAVRGPAGVVGIGVGGGVFLSAAVDAYRSGCR